MIPYDRANQIGLQQIQAWLPDGYREGDEWKARNPTRLDNDIGSFGVNLYSGAFNDYADPDFRGRDTVALYAALNRGTLERELLAGGKNVRNTEGAIQALAARAILEQYDPAWFPDDSADFTPPAARKEKKAGTGFWDGWRPAGRGVAEAPELTAETVEWPAKKFGPEVARWDGFQDRSGRVLFWIVRHLSEGGKKTDVPYSLWTDGSGFRWRAKHFEGETPLYRLPELLARENDPILLVEGQSCADKARAVLGETWLVTAWYGQIEAVGWEQLRGREVWFWFDPDRTGRDKLRKVKAVLEGIDCRVHVVASPSGKPKGWDVGDAIAEGWSEAQLVEHIMGQGEKTPEPTGYLDDEMPFRIAGTTNSDVWFYARSTRQISHFRKAGLTKNALFTIMARELWGQYFRKPEGGIAWDNAIDWVIQESNKTPIFDPSRQRGSGAWREGTEVVVNNGEAVLKGGKTLDLYEASGEYFYERDTPLPYSYDGAMTSESAALLLRATERVRWTHELDGVLFAGWLLLAPWASVLEWRPHLWLSGARGTGKTTILKRIVFPVLQDFAIKALGSSTPAGIRQALRNSGRSLVVDEAESDNRKQEEYIQEYLTMARQASSAGEAKTLHGSTGGEAVEWIVQSMILFASIGASIRQGADADRITKVTLKSNKKGEVDEGYPELEKAMDELTPAWALSFHARSLNILPEILKAVDQFRRGLASVLGSRRDSDQVGTLLAGAYMITHDKAPMASEVRQWLDGLDLESVRRVEEKTDEELLFDEILSYRTEIVYEGERYPGTVGAFLCGWFFSQGKSSILPDDYVQTKMPHPEKLLDYLTSLGLKPVARQGTFLQVAGGCHSGLRKILDGTPWRDSYVGILQRLPFCIDGLSGPGFFGAVRKQYIRLDVSGVFRE
jgi:putative DNA primase/helicase